MLDASVETIETVTGVIARQILAERYELLGLVGVGGMGSVYRARDVELSEVVALKMLRRELVDTPGMLARFRLEVRLARRVTHHNVARVFDIGEHGGEKFLTMEFIDGESLGSIIARDGAFPLSRVMEIATGVCAGLGSAHAAGVVHRDLKPDNVLLGRDGRVVVTDFGIARAFQDIGIDQTAGTIVGTPAYMAPEQVEGRKDVDARADIYAFGALLYELLTGQRPWSGETAFAVASARLLSPPPDPRQKCPELPRACAELVMRCMARSRDDRFATIEQAAAELSVLTLPVHHALGAPQVTVRPLVTVRSADIEETRALSSDKTVAVLPFRNAGPAEDEYLAEELTDDLLDSLSMTRGLKVRSRGAVMKFKGVERDARDLGQELGVQVVVEGSVRRARGHVRISARLTSVADGFQLWAKRFDRPEQDVLSINDDAASAIAEALTVDRKPCAREAPTDPAAVDLYLRARHEHRKQGVENQKRAVALFEQAEALAPGDPMLLAGKAMALARQAFFYGEGAPQALAVARQAVAAGPMLAEARLSLGSTLLQTGDWKGATRELRQAVARGPGLAETHGALGRLLAEAGDLHLGIRLLETARMIDPQTPFVSSALARSYALLGDWARCDSILDVTETSAFDLPARMRFLMWRRDVAGAEALLARLLSRGEQDLPIVKVLRFMIDGELPERFSMFPRGTGPGDARRNAFLLQMDAETAMFFGREERALTGLQESAEQGLIDIAWVDRCPLFEPLRADPRFAQLRAPVARRAEEILEAYRSP